MLNLKNMASINIINKKVLSSQGMFAKFHASIVALGFQGRLIFKHPFQLDIHKKKDH